MRLSIVLASLLLTTVASYAQDGGCFGRGPSPTFNTPVRSFLYDNLHNRTAARSTGCMGSVQTAGTGCMGATTRVAYVPTTVTTTRTAYVPTVVTTLPKTVKTVTTAAPKMTATGPKTVAGKVSNIGLSPGRADMVRIDVFGASTPSYLSFTDKDSEVSLDGLAVSIDGLTDKFLASKNGMTVTMYPLVERYGLSLKAEFVTVK